MLAIFVRWFGPPVTLAFLAGTAWAQATAESRRIWLWPAYDVA